MSTLQKIFSAVQYLERDYVPKAKARRFRLGVIGLSLGEFSSLNSLGRKLGVNRWTGENRVRRLVSDNKLADRLEKLLIKEGLSGGGLIYCSLDHSQFGPFCIAVLAVSVRKGRSIPIWCQVNKSESGLIKPLLFALKHLNKILIPNQKIILVMDRWFCGIKLFELIRANGWYFISRAKYDRRVHVPWEYKSIPIGEISHYELPVIYHEMELRMV